jgi:hypothetical protein
MIQKLLLIIRLLFLKFSNLFFGKLFNPSLKLVCLVVFLIIGSFNQINGANRYLIASGAWNTNAIWSGSSGGSGGASFPVAGDNVFIDRGFTVTINSPAYCSTIAISNNVNASATISISGTNSLTVSGLISMARPANSFIHTIAVGDGSLTTGSLTMSATTTGRNNIISISTGTVIINGLVTTGTTGCQFNFTGAGLLDFEGSFSGGPATLTPSTGTVEYSGSSQTIQNFSAGYNNLTLSGSGTKSFPASIIAISNVLNINSGVVANLSTVMHTAKTLILGGLTMPQGTWGSSSSTATNKNDIYFTATTGRVNVAACTAPTAFTLNGTGGSFCSSSTGSALSLSGSQTGINYQLVRGSIPVGSAIPGTGSGLNFGSFNATGVYTVLATNTSTSCSAVMTSSVTIYRYSSPPTPTATAVNVSCPGDATGTITITNAVAPASVSFVSANNQGIDLGTSLLSNRGAFTIEGWIKFDPANYINRMALFGQNDVIEIGFEGNNLRFWTPYGTVDLPLTSFPTGNAWHHIAATADGSTIKIYLDGGTPVSSGATTTNFGSNTNTTKIGYGVMDAAGVGFTGEIFKLGFWNRALTVAEITTLSSGFVEYDASLNGLLAGYSFNEGTGSTLAAVGSVAPTGTLIGTTAPQWTDPYTYTWTSTPAGFTSNSKNLTALTNRTYNLTTSLKGCTNTGSWAVNANNLTTTITGQSTATQTKCIGDAFSAITVTATGTGLTYQWYRNSSASTSGGTSLLTANGANTNSYTPQSTTAATIFYYCIITGTCGSATTTISGSFVTNPLPTAPTVSTITGVNCTGPGSVLLTNLPTGNWTINQTGTAPASYVNTTPNTTSYTVTGLALGGYYFTVNNGTCTSVQTSVVNINDQTSTTWDGTTWLGGPPTATKNVIINSVSTQPFTADTEVCSLTINSTGSVIIPTGVTLKVNNALTTNNKLIFENNSSLMQNTNAVNTGNITYKRIAPKIRQADFVYWSTPVSPQTLFNVSQLTMSDKFFYNNAPGWIAINSSSVMEIGKGYIIRGPETYSNTVKADYEASFIGVPNNGDYSTPSLTVARYHLIGNPYPSALSVDKLIDGNTVLNGAVYLWTHNTSVNPVGNYNYNPSDYATYNRLGSVGTVAPTGNTSNPSEKPTGFIGAGQAFFVSTKLAGPVNFTNSMREAGTNNSQFFKSSGTSKETAVERDRVWLNLISGEGAFKQLLVGYTEGATNGYENRYDAITMDGNTYMDFYSMINANKFTIQGRALPFVDTDIVPLGYRTSVAGTFTISIDEVDGKMSNQAIFIEDKVTGTIQDLRYSNYTFTSEIGAFTDRLVLRYTGKTLGTGDFENVEDGILISVKNKVINVLSSKENIKEVTVYDVTGKLLYNKKKVGTTELQIQNLPSSNQVLLVKVTLANDFTTTRKVIFQ